MVKTKKELLTSAPWRAESQESDEKFKDARLKVTSQPGTTSTMHVPGKKKAPNSLNDEEYFTEIDPELRYSFQRNFQVQFGRHEEQLDDASVWRGLWILRLSEMCSNWRLRNTLSSLCNSQPGVQHENAPTAGSFLQRVFSIDTIVKPLPPAMAYNVSRNLTFFTRIFTQFFDPEGIANAQKSLGLGQEEKARNVR